MAATCRRQGWPPQKAAPRSWAVLARAAAAVEQPTGLTSSLQMQLSTSARQQRMQQPQQQEYQLRQEEAALPLLPSREAGLQRLLWKRKAALLQLDAPMALLALLQAQSPQMMRCCRRSAWHNPRRLRGAHGAAPPGGSLCQVRPRSSAASSTARRQPISGRASRRCCLGVRRQDGSRRHEQQQQARRSGRSWRRRLRLRVAGDAVRAAEAAAKTCCGSELAAAMDGAVSAAAAAEAASPARLPAYEPLPRGRRQRQVAVTTRDTRCRLDCGSERHQTFSRM